MFALSQTFHSFSGCVVDVAKLFLNLLENFKLALPIKDLPITKHVNFTFVSKRPKWLSCKETVRLVLGWYVWKVSKYGVFSGLYFPAFGHNTERYVSFRIQSKCRKIRTRKNSVFAHFSRSDMCKTILFRTIRTSRHMFGRAI